MRTILLCFFALVVLAAATPRTSHADDGAWTRVYSRPAPTIYGIEMVDDNVGLALTAAGILRTADGGRSWTEPYPIAAFTYGDLAFADAKRAWAVAGSGVIRRTDDAGLTWRLQQSGTDVHLHRIAVISTQEAWITGAGEGFDDSPRPVSPPSVLLHTTDGGATWRNEPPAGYGQFFNIAFVGRTGWLVASPCAEGQPFDACDPQHRMLLRTDDGGRHWQILSETPGVVPERMQWLDAKHGFATSFVLTEPASGSGILPFYRTDDGGRHWTRIDAAPDTVNEIHFRSARDGWISANFCAEFECSSAVAHTTDGGVTWTPARNPDGSGEFFAVTSRTLLLGVNSPDPLATGIARLDLASLQWSATATAATQSLRSIKFASRDRGYALANSRLLVTDDGGATWSLRDAPPFDSIDAPGGDVVWGATICCSESAAVHRSIDGAKTWQERPAPFGQPLAIQAFDAERAIVSSSHDGLWRTDDGGATWRQIDRTAYGYGPLTFIDNQHGWTLACAPYICIDSFRVTSDGGATWETRPLPHDATIPSFVTPDIGWATRTDCPGTGGDCSTVVIATSDGGRTWNEIGRAPTTLYGLTFAGPSRGWATGYGPAGELLILATTDGGRTWTTESAADGMFAKDFAKTDGRIWLLTAVGIQGGSDRSTIYRHDFAPEPAPPPAKPRVRLPNTGSRPGSSASSAWPLDVLLACTGLFALAAGAVTGRKRAKPPARNR